MLREIGAPPVHANAGRRRPLYGITHGVESHVDAKHAEPGERQRNRVTPASHRHVQRRPVLSLPRRKPRNPLGDEGGRLRAFAASAFAEASADHRRCGGGWSASQAG